MKTMNENQIIEELINKNPEFKKAEKKIKEAIDLICRTFEKGNKLYIAGNGGSMSDALHISAELLKAFKIKRTGLIKSSLGLQAGVPVWVLGNNPALYSAVGNDFKQKGLEFAQELFASGKEGDVLLGISTSGRAENIQNAFQTARQIGVKTVSLTGNPGEPLSGQADISIKTIGGDTAQIQENHVKVYHILCMCIEEALFGKKGRLTGPYKTRFDLFDFSKIKTYSLLDRKNRSDINRLSHPKNIKVQPAQNKKIAFLAEKTVEYWKERKPVIIMMGAHLLKNGFSPLLIDLVNRGIISLIAGNGACPIHDTELAICGGTSERVSKSLPTGNFGFAEETAIVINSAYFEAFKRKMGAGEALGAILAGDIRLKGDPNAGKLEFPYKKYSIFYSAYRNKIPITIHGTIGTDIVDQHPNSLFEAKGYACGVDFSIFAQMASCLKNGGIIIDIGGAVTQPEVLLKSVSMAANIGKPPRGIVTAVFDLFDVDLKDMDNEEKPGYYRRDIKSIVMRIPHAFKGKGLYIQGNHKKTFVEYYSHIIYLLENRAGI